MNPEPAPKRARWLLVAGLLLGIGAAAFGVLRDGSELPPQAVARVNDRLILRDAWLRAIAAVSSERRTPLTEADKRHILQRLIDEELLVQRGVALGLIEQDRRLRGQLVSDVIATSTAAEAGAVEEVELRRFYLANGDVFTPPGRVRVAVWAMTAAGARVAFAPPVPDALLPPVKLRAYLGPALTNAALQLQPGQSSAPRESGGQRVVVEMLEREPGLMPAFEQVSEQVRAEYLRRRDEQSLRRLLTELRQNGAVVVRETAE